MLSPLTATAALVEVNAASEQAVASPIALAIPLGATEPRPVVIAQQSIEPDVSALCRKLHAIADSLPFVLCQFRAPARDAATDKGKELERQLKQALATTKRRFGGHVASGPAVMVTIAESSRGAAKLVSREPGFFSRVLSLSQRFEGWGSANATNFGRAGGKRALLSSAREADMNAMLHRKNLFMRAGAEAEVVHYTGVWAPDPLLAFVGQHWAWLVAKDERFGRQQQGAD